MTKRSTETKHVQLCFLSIGSPSMLIVLIYFCVFSISNSDLKSISDTLFQSQEQVISLSHLGQDGFDFPSFRGLFEIHGLNCESWSVLCASTSNSLHLTPLNLCFHG